jgi:glutathione S-transferase
MQLYFSPMACSMATRISFYEAGANADFVAVDPKTKRTADGADFRAINPMGLVPTLRTDDGDVLTENAAILQYVADRFPDAALAPKQGLERTRLQQWLNFIGTELHKVVFAPLLSSTANEGAKQFALESAKARLDIVEQHLANREFLLDRFTVADAYLVTVLGWSIVTPVDLKLWPSLARYVARLAERPSVKRALAEERALYTKAR